MTASLAGPDAVSRPSARACGAGARPLVVGLVNNMPDAAVFATETQFRRLIETAAAGRPVDLRLLILEGVPRSRAALSRMGGRYQVFRADAQEPLDGLIVTGAEPHAANLDEEPYWPALRALVDWAQINTTSAVWSCLAAHAAVYHLNGIPRRRLARKLSGVFPVQAASDHRLTAGFSAECAVPHSRLNSLPAKALEASGYQILTWSELVGADAFIREGESLFVFFQGHPEYDAATLLLEYQRDLRRFIKGEQPAPPLAPVGYFNVETAAALDDVSARAAARPSENALAESAAIMARSPPEARWSAWSEHLYSRWFELLLERARADGATPKPR